MNSLKAKGPKAGLCESCLETREEQKTMLEQSEHGGQWQIRSEMERAHPSGVSSEVNITIWLLLSVRQKDTGEFWEAGDMILIFNKILVEPL